MRTSVPLLVLVSGALLASAATLAAEEKAERQIDFGLQSKDAALPRGVLDSFIAAIQCH